MLRPAKKLREIRQLCHLRSLKGEELDALFVETGDARDAEQSVRQTIRSALDDDSPQRLLLCGHRGCGKSTELAKLVEELGAGWLCVTFSIVEDLPPVGVLAEEILLAIAHRLVQAAATEKLQALDTDPRIKAIDEWFRAITKTETRNRESSVEANAATEIGTGGLLAGLFKVSTRISSDLKYRGTAETSVVEEVRKRPADLIEQINRLVESIQEALHPSGRRLIIIVEDLDKLSIADAHGIFIQNGQMLANIRAHIIYTIPIFTFTTPDADAMRALFDDVFSLPMIKVCQPGGAKVEEGFAVIRKIVDRRIDPGALERDALELLIEKTGGVLRHIFEVLQTVTSMTRLRVLPIRREHITYGLGRLRTQLGIQVALPRHVEIPDVNKIEQLYERLRDCARKCREGKPCPPTGNPIDQVLLQSCALVEYNGERWLGVHPLIIDYLKDVGYEV